MITIDTLRKLALSFPETTEEPHFEKTSFRIKKKIFATYDDQLKQTCVKLSEMDQDVVSSTDRVVIHPVENKWGKKGWTIIDMKKVHRDFLVDALTAAYCEVAPKRLAHEVRRNHSEKG
jgi:predicted DNA-binding protein (MmcQ/YjbR family)